MLGAIIGDIVGSRWEFNPTNDYNFKLFSDKNSYTDDTICTVAVADALLHDSDDFGAYIHKWCRKYPHPMGGYGGSFVKWIMSDNPQPYGSYGNGSAMRVSPIGWWLSNDIWEMSAKSAACTHNHEEGIRGAQAVVWAMADAKELRNTYGNKLTSEILLKKGLAHGVGIYEEFPQNFKINLNKCRNRFDVTCQGTVPVALWIVLHSKNFEDAIRQAVSLGADADTLGAIVGSIAERLWGIPEWMKKKALSYLPRDIKNVVKEFHKRTIRLRQLSKRCQYYVFDDFVHLSDEDKEACDIEREWTHYLARSYAHAKLIKEEMTKRFPIADWQNVADDYDLPVSLVGTIAKHILTPKHKSLKSVIKFLEAHYSIRKPLTAKKKEKKEKFLTLNRI
ncbi:MAG: ADP-ribosylglycohydrolase family protein [Candidatus Egerieousia sp.]